MNPDSIIMKRYIDCLISFLKQANGGLILRSKLHFPFGRSKLIIDVMTCLTNSRYVCVWLRRRYEHLSTPNWVYTASSINSSAEVCVYYSFFFSFTILENFRNHKQLPFLIPLISVISGMLLRPMDDRNSIGWTYTFSGVALFVHSRWGLLCTSLRPDLNC